MPASSDSISVKFISPWKLLIFIPVAFLFLGLCSGCKSPPLRLIRAENGVLDLSGWDFEEQGPVRLDGEWEFYWNEFLESGDFPRDAESVQNAHLPALWREVSVGGGRLPPVGHATYRLTVKGLSAGRHRPDTLFVHGFLSVCNVRVNGMRAGGTGRVGRSRGEEVPVAHSTFARFDSAGSNLEIILQASNFHNSQGGIKSSVWLGGEQQVRLMATRKWVRAGLLGGTLLIMALFHLGLFLIRRKETVNLYFGLYCFLWAIQNLFGVSGGCLMANIFPSIPWRLTIDLCILLFGAAPSLLVMFYHDLFPHQHSIRINRVYQVLGGICLVYAAVTPPNAFDPPILFFVLVTQSAMLYLFAMFARDIFRGKKSALALAPGYLILAVSWLNNIFYYDLQLNRGVYLVPYGTFIFILFHSFYITKRFSRAFHVINTLSGKLDLMEKRQKSLKLTERRLSRMLDSIGHAVLTVNPAGEIAYANHDFKELTGHRPGDVLGRSALEFFPEPRDSHGPSLETSLLQREATVGTVHYPGIALKHADASVVRVDLSLSVLELDGDDLSFVTLKKHPPNGGRTRAPVEDALQSQLKVDREHLEKIRSHLDGKKPVNGALDDLDRFLDRQLNRPCCRRAMLGRNADGEKRNLGTQVMAAACDLWASDTGQSKADLAEQSGLWTVYINRDGWARTQTLDKYLNSETLPGRPRWKNIVDTANFVLARCKGPFPEKHALERKLGQLKELL